MKNLFPLGTKVKIPKTKLGKPHKTSDNASKQAKKQGQDYLVYNGPTTDFYGNTSHLLWINYDKTSPTGDWYYSSEIIQYDEQPKLKTLSRNNIVRIMSTVNIGVKNRLERGQTAYTTTELNKILSEQLEELYKN